MHAVPIPLRQSNRWLRWTLTACLATVLLSACDRDREPLSVSTHVWLGYEPLFLARSMGWLDGQRVELIEVDSAVDSLKALAAGRVDGAALTLDEVLLARSQGLDLVVVLVFNVSVGADVIMAREPLGSLADLAGKRIGFEAGAVGHLMVLKALEQAGLGLDDIKLVNVQIGQQIAAVKDDRVDVIVTYEPTASRLRAEGLVPIFDSREIPDLIVDVLAIRRERLNAHRSDALRHLTAAHFRGLEHVHRNPQDAAFRMATRLGLPASEVLPAYRGLVLPDLDNNRRLLVPELSSLMASARQLSEFKAGQGLIPPDQPVDDLLSDAYLPSPGRRP